MDYNSNGTIERYDMLRSVTLDPSRLEAMVELGLGSLRYWTAPSHWQQLYMLMEHEQSVINIETNKKQQKKNVAIKNNSSPVKNLDKEIVILETNDKQQQDQEITENVNLPTAAPSPAAPAAPSAPAPASSLKKKKKKILPQHENGNGVSFYAFARCILDPAASLAKWEQSQASQRRKMAASEAEVSVQRCIGTALDLVDPPEVRQQRQIDHENFRARERNAMINAGVALIHAANGGRTESSSSDDDGNKSRSIGDNEEHTEIVHEVAMTNEQMLERLQVATTRSKILHFLAVARIPKMELVKEHVMLKKLLAAEDKSGGVAPSPGIVRHLMSPTDGEKDNVVDVRRLMPLLGWDSRVDMLTLERLPGFEKVVEEKVVEEKVVEEKMVEEKVEGEIESQTAVEKMDDQVEGNNVPRGNPVDVVRQLRENK